MDLQNEVSQSGGENIPQQNIFQKMQSRFDGLHKMLKISLTVVVALVVLLIPLIIAQQTNLFSHAGISLLSNCTPIPAGLTQQQIQELTKSGKVNWCTSVVNSAPKDASIHSLPGNPTPPALGSVYHNVMFVGDSITAGWTNDGSQAYPILTISGLYNHNQGNAWYQLVKGRSGAISAGALLDLKAFEIQPKNVNLMIVELGTNDMVHMSAATFRSNYQALIDYLLVGSPNAQLVCLGPWRSTTDNFGYDRIAAYENVVRDVCKSSTNDTALYIDLSTLYANKTYHNTTGDMFHPNNAGAQAIANAIVRAVYPNSPK